MEEKSEGMYGAFLERVRSFENRMGQLLTSFTSMFESPTLDPDLFPAPQLPKVFIQSDNFPARETFLIRTQPNPFASDESDWSSRTIVSWNPSSQPRLNGFTNFIDESGIPSFVSRPVPESTSIPEDGKVFSWYQLPLIVYSFIGIIFLMMTFVLTALLIRRNKLKKIRRARAREIFSPITENSTTTTDDNKAAFEAADAPPEYSLVMDAAKNLPPHSPPAYSKNEEKRDEKSSEKPQNSPRD